jgi:hypothetical protein
MVVWNTETGDFKNATQMAVNAEIAEETFELTYGEHLKVIHTYEGVLPPKVYRSLPYIN